MPATDSPSTPPHTGPFSPTRSNFKLPIYPTAATTKPQAATQGAVQAATQGAIQGATQGAIQAATQGAIQTATQGAIQTTKPQAATQGAIQGAVSEAGIPGHAAAVAGSSAAKPECVLSVVATKPVDGTPPYPTLLLLNGFQCQARWYQHFADRLASWGFVVLQYTNPAFKIIPDASELPFMDSLLTWAELSHSTPGHFLNGCLDMGALGVAGHSRGAKLAALHYSADARFRSAVLLDPVNNTKYTPKSVEYPDACKALKSSGRPVGIIGAGVIGSGNPEGSNWRNFYESAPSGSWVASLPTAGHLGFCQPGCGLWDWAFKLLLGDKSQLSPDLVLERSTPMMVAWLKKTLRHPVTQPSLTQPATPLEAAALTASAGASEGAVHETVQEGGGTATCTAAITASTSGAGGTGTGIVSGTGSGTGSTAAGGAAGGTADVTTVARAAADGSSGPGAGEESLAGAGEESLAGAGSAHEAAWPFDGVEDGGGEGGKLLGWIKQLVLDGAVVLQYR